MHMRKRENLSRPVMSLAILTVILGAAALGVAAQTPQQGAAAPALEPYTAPDQSAQAGLPPGWKVTKGGDTVIIMTGPNGETIALGNTYVVRNAAFQLGQKPGNGIDLSIPNSASLDQKFTMLMQWASAASGTPDAQLKIASNTPIQLTIPNVQCGRMSGTFVEKSGTPVAFGLLMCSLPVDTGGAYKIMYKMAQAPPNVAAQEKALAGAVFASYRVAPAQLKLKLAPHFSPPPPPQMTAGGSGAAAAMNSTTMNMMRGADISSTCMDLGVIREEPNWQLPQECGGRAPNP